MAEPFDFRDAVTGLDLTVYFRKRQERASWVEQYQSPAWGLDFGVARAPTRARGMVLGGWSSLCLALGPGSAVWSGQEAPPGTMGLLPPGTEADGSTVADFHWLTVAIRPDLWRQCVVLAGLGDAPPRQFTVCRPPPAQFASLRKRLLEVRRRFRECPHSEAGLCPLADRTEALVVEAFAAACELAAGGQPPAGSLRNRARLARRAEEWMLAHLAEPWRMTELCAVLRVSRRELEYAFRSVFDQSPREYLETLRLHAIRRELLRPGARHGKVTDIAYAHGMQHLGRLAACYRSLFGENPADTLRRP
jgi:AraC family ethanolamine operon transcriptional activator